MNPKHTQQLKAYYPTLYETLDWFECEDGWYVLVDDLSRSLCAIKSRKGLNVKVVQVKWKFGLFRFHYQPYRCDEDINACIGVACRLAAVTCELCGKPGQHYSNRNERCPMVLCVAHAQPS